MLAAILAAAAIVFCLGWDVSLAMTERRFPPPWSVD
jgi:hypothetical protein